MDSPCHIADFVGGMIKMAKQSPAFIGADNPMSPKLDVTATVKKVYPSVNKATLTIFGNLTDKIFVIGPYDQKPAPLTPGQIVANWKGGWEVERQKCQKDGKWYWVVYPAELKTEPPITGYMAPKPIVNATPENETFANLKDNPYLLAIAGIIIGLVILFLIRKA